MKTLLTVAGVLLSLVAGYLVVYGDDALAGLFVALCSAALMILTSDSVWKERE